MLPNVTFKHYRKLGSETVLVLLHGAGPNGVESDFIRVLFNELSDKNVSVFGFNFAYCERGDEQSSGAELKEEQATLNEIVTYLKDQGYKKLVIVAKSLGGITASYWFGDSRSNTENCELAILGFVVGDIKVENVKNNLILVIQGEKDKYGNAETVIGELAKHDVSVPVIEIANADHSYRDSDKQPTYMQKAMDELKKHLSIK